MPDPRIESYAKLLVEHCLDVEPGHQVIVTSTPLARPLVEEVARCLARKGAYALVRLSFSGVFGALDLGWIREASEAALSQASSIDRHELENADGWIAIQAPENTRDAAAVPPDRLAMLRAAYRPAFERMFAGELQWVGCHYPCPALAQESEMTLSEFEDFLYGASLLDWDAEAARLQRYADRFDAADEIRIVGTETNLRLSLAGRAAKVDAGGVNIPGGEVYMCPVEDSAEGTITFGEFTARLAGRDVPGIRLRFEGGRVLDASAEGNEEFLIETLDTDDGARRIGELGIGCNPGITRYMKNVAFDEKIDGTVHVAVGNGFPDIGGTNVSNIHWDIVKDLRQGGRIELDGELVQEGGRWLI
jgi:aminopeptidase